MSFPWFPTPCLTQLAGRREAVAQRGPEGTALALPSPMNLCWFKREIRIEVPEKQPFPEAWAFLGVGSQAAFPNPSLGWLGTFCKNTLVGAKFPQQGRGYFMP